MDLSVVIVNWNTKDFLRGCLRSIAQFPPSCSYEVIVVDNASADGSADMVRDEFPDVRLIANTGNLMYAEGNNQGIDRSSGEFILLLNPDTEVKAGSLNALLASGREHPDAGAVGCRLISPDGSVQCSVRGFPAPMAVLWEYSRLSIVFPKSRKLGAYRMRYFRYDREAEVDQPMGSCLLLSRAAWCDVDKFDKEFPIFFNEVDWCYRAKLKGWKIYFTPSAEVFHHGGAGTGQMKPEMCRESHRSLWRFYKKHYRSHIPIPVYWLIGAAIAVNSFLTSRFKALAD